VFPHGLPIVWTPLQGYLFRLPNRHGEKTGVELYEEESTELDRSRRYLRSGQCTGPFYQGVAQQVLWTETPLAQFNLMGANRVVK